MVADLQEVDVAQPATGDQERLDRSLGIAGEQGTERPMAQEGDDRAVVDVAIEQRCCGVVGARIEDLERGGGVELEYLARPGQRQPGRRPLGRIGQQQGVRGVLERNAAVQHEADAMPLQHVHQARDVVLVRMGQEQDIDASREVRPLGS